jgi:hypothetical protein
VFQEAKLPVEVAHYFAEIRPKYIDILLFDAVEFGTCDMTKHCEGAINTANEMTENFALLMDKVTTKNPKIAYELHYTVRESQRMVNETRAIVAEFISIAQQPGGPTISAELAPMSKYPALNPKYVAEVLAKLEIVKPSVARARLRRTGYLVEQLGDIVKQVKKAGKDTAKVKNILVKNTGILTKTDNELFQLKATATEALRVVNTNKSVEVFTVLQKINKTCVKIEGNLVVLSEAMNELPVASEKLRGARKLVDKALTKIRGKRGVHNVFIWGKTNMFGTKASAWKVWYKKNLLRLGKLKKLRGFFSRFKLFRAVK